jgi:hypothetical protein
MELIAALSDSYLLVKTKSLVAEEKRITQEVLNHLEEIESRKLYLARGFSSLFDFCVNELKYSESSAHRRISAMRIIRNIPEAKRKLEEGSVNLSTLTQLHGFLRREEKAKNYSHEMKIDLLEKISDKSQNQCEREFIKISPSDVALREKERALTEDLTQLTIVASKELMAKLELLRNLMAHKNSNPSIAELVELSVDMALKELNPAARSVSRPSNFVSAEGAVKHKFTSAAKVEMKFSRYIPASTKHHIWNRDHGCCQYTDKETNKKCQSKFALQIDHIHPFSLGGSHQSQNLRLLCRAHNNWRTKELLRH